VTLRAGLGKARLFLQIDVAFGDKVVPAPTAADLPPVLDDLPPAHMAVYPKSAVVAEKFQIIVSLGIPNSRMKDFYDTYMIAEHSELDGPQLANAIRATFSTRGTPVPKTPPVALTAAFSDDASKRAQWRAFLRKSDISQLPLEQVIRNLNDFLMPPAQAVAEGKSFDEEWVPGGPWTR
jgi:hypothetical protein